jgi:hypothetical protein
MAYMEVAVGLGRETCVEASAVLTLAEIVGHDLFHEVQATCFSCRLYVFFFSHNDNDDDKLLFQNLYAARA